MSGAADLTGAIAVVAMDGRFPGAPDVEGLWRLLLAGGSGIRALAPAEIRAAGTDEATRTDPAFVARAGIVEDEACFDAAHFGYLPREAAAMDPQHRLFLECSWRLLERAGHAPTRAPGRVGVFAGCGLNGYDAHVLRADRAFAEALGSFQARLAGDKDHVATRVAYKLDLRGPALTVQTNCSTSLVAVHLAAQALLSYQCDMAIAGGASIPVPQRRGYLYREGMILSPDGTCRPFDAAAAGTVPAGGVAGVLLRRLEDALADGDPVWAVIRGSAINNDGAAKVGYTAPGVEGQAAVIADALAVAGVDPRTIRYVETHGTATALGDALEIAALTRAWRAWTADTGFCRLGALKATTGHMDTAAGVGGLIVACLALHHGVLPPLPHFTTPNPELALPTTPFTAAPVAAPWPDDAHPRRAAVSAFGLGGTNAHVVLEQAPAREPLAPEALVRPVVLPLSARTPAQLGEAATALAGWLRDTPDAPLADVQRTLAQGRVVQPCRAAVTGRDAAALVTALERVAATPPSDATGAAGVVLLFPGGGAQHPGMAAALYRTEPVFRAELDACLDAVAAEFGLDVRAPLLAATGDAVAAAALARPSLGLPALVAVELALAALWRAWGVAPAALLGHSAGEYAAACVAGAITREEALRLVTVRGLLFETLPPGAMLAVPIGETEARRWCDDTIALAAVNAVDATVLSGARDAIARLEATLERAGIEPARVRIDVAAHSPELDPILDRFAAVAGGVRASAPRIPYVSNVTGDWIGDAAIDAGDYFVRHLRGTVRFADGVSRLLAAGHRVFVEAGPGRTLAGAVRRAVTAAGVADACVMPSLAHPGDAQGDDALALAEATARLWARGVALDWPARDGAPRRRLPLPPTPFARTRHWIGADPDAAARALVSAPASGPEAVIAMPLPAASAGLDRAAVRDTLRTLLAELAGAPLRDDDDDAPFLALGFDSLLLTQAAQAISRRFGVRLRFRQLLEEVATPRALVDHLVAHAPPVAAAPAPAAPAPAAPAAPAPAVPAPAPSVTRAVATGEAPTDAAIDTAFDTTIDTALDAPMGAALDATVQGVIERQLRLMADQLETLRALAGAPRPVVAPAARTTPVTPAAARATPRVPAPVGHATAAAPAAVEVPTAFGPYRPPVRRGAALDERQRAYVASLVAGHGARTAGSRAWAQAHRRHLADPRAIVGFRPDWKGLVYPLVVAHAEGARMRDVDGNEYVDLVMGFGANLLGHMPPAVHEACARAIAEGGSLGMQTRLAGEVAGLVSELTGMPRVTFCNTGSEAVMTAIRLARARTGRRRIAVFNGAYHGTFDEVLVRPQRGASGTVSPRPIAPGVAPHLVGETLVVEYGDPDALRLLEAHAHDLAAVLVEPVQSRRPGLVPVDFLHALRARCSEWGTALVFDEMVTGFRCHPGGAQALFGVRADLATYGKIAGGGMPIGLVTGTPEYMDAIDGGFWEYGDASGPEADLTFFAGTFCKHPVAVAAAHAVLTRLRDAGPALQRDLDARAEGLVARLQPFLDARGVPLRLERFSSLVRLTFDASEPHAPVFFYPLLARGVHLWEGRTAFLSTAHDDEALAHVERAVRESVDELQAAGFLVGAPRTDAIAPSSQRAAPVAAPPAAAPPADTPPALAAAAPAPVALPAGAVRWPLSEAQREVWLATLAGDDASVAYDESFALRVPVALDEATVRRALALLAARHEALRTTIDAAHEAQLVHAELAPALVASDLAALPAADRTAAFDALRAAEAATVFDLARGPLWRAHLVRLGDADSALVLTFHHLVYDGWSLGVLLRDLAACHEAAAAGTVPALPPAEPYAAFARRVEAERTATADAALAWWTAQHRDPAPPLALPLDTERPARRAAAAVHATRTLAPDVTGGILATAARGGSTPVPVLLAGWSAFLHRLTGADDLVVGMTAASQAAAGAKGVVGHGVHVLPLRLRPAATLAAEAWIAAVRDATYDALEHAGVTFGTVVRAVKPPRHPGRTPLVEVLFNYERTGEPPRLAGVAATVVATPKAGVAFDVVLHAVHAGDALRLEASARADIIGAATLARWLADFEAVLAAFVRDPAAPIGDAPAAVASAPAAARPATVRTAGDVEALLRAHPEVADAAVTLHERPGGGRRVLAYVVPRGGAGSGDGTPPAWWHEEAAGHFDALYASAAADAGPDGATDEAFGRWSGIADIAEQSEDFYAPTVAALRALAPRRVLELGCGTGRILRPLAPACEAYWGTDVSPAVVAQLARDVAADGFAHVTLLARAAEDLSGIPTGHFDLVVLNSVAQYFPGVDYLRLVLERAAAALRPGGRIFVGDVQSFTLRLQHQWWAQRDRLAGDLPAARAHEQLARKAAETAEFIVDPSVFAALAAALPGGWRCEVQLRRGCFMNEPTRFHYDVLLRPASEAASPTRWRELVPAAPTLDALAAALAGTTLGDDEGCVVRGMPNARLVAEARGVALLASAPARTVAWIREAAGAGDAGIDPEAVHALAARHGLELFATWAADERPDHMDLHFRRAGDPARAWGVEEPAWRLVPWRQQASEPVRALQAMRLPGVVRAWLDGRTPAALVPDDVLVLDALPRTDGGAVDRRALPRPAEPATPAREVVAPSTDTERTLARIWSDVLRVPVPSVHDDVFALGGDSIDIFRIATRAAREGLRLDPRDFFEWRTIAALAVLADAPRWDEADVASTAEAAR